MCEDPDQRLYIERFDPPSANTKNAGEDDDAISVQTDLQSQAGKSHLFHSTLLANVKFRQRGSPHANHYSGFLTGLCEPGSFQHVRDKSH
jgi:hypothetical protein